ncbi:MAG: CHAT domain-containing protein [Micropruina sp.]|uniref:CHAT domain-containing protein n=1 Tax=Micropruina sp. TaxID=2737536 RepID=UPI0039E62829
MNDSLLPAGREGLPPEVTAAWDEQDFDAVAAWLLEVPAARTWGASAREKALVLAEVFLPIDPGLSLRLADRLLTDGGTDIHLMEVSIDAASRAGLREGMDARVERLRLALKDAAPDDRIAVLNNVGTFLKEGRLFDRAEAVLREALAETAPSAATRGTVLVNLATVLSDRAWSSGADAREGSAAALEVLDQAEQVATESGETRLLGNVWFNRGHILAVAGASAPAAHAYRMAEQHFVRAGGDPVDLAYVHRARAADAGRNGRLDEAIADYARARDLFADAGRLDESATSAVGLVMAMQLSGDAPTAGQLEDVLAALRRSRPDRVPELLVNLGNIAAEQNLDRAAGYFADAEEVFRAQGRLLDVERARHSRAVIRRRSGDAAGAVPVLRAVHATYLRWDLSVKAAEAEFNLAIALRDLGDPEAAVHALSAFEVLDRHRHQLGTASDRSGLTRVTYRHLLDLTLDTAIADPDTVAALAERARTQTSAAEHGVPGSDQLSVPSPVRARPEAPVIGGNGPIRTLSALARGLAGSRAVWLTWVRHRGQLLSVVVRDDDTDVTTLPYPEELLTALNAAVGLTDASGDGSPGGDGTGLRSALYRMATGPLLADADLADRLRRSMRPSTIVPWASGPNGEGANLLRELGDLLISDLAWSAPDAVIAPPTFLGEIPWAALERDGTHWIEHSRLVLAPPVSTIRTDPTTEGGTGRAWVADASGDLRYCRRVLREFPHLCGSDATAAAVIEALRGTARAVVRTHVRSGSPARPREAALLLADGPLTADDLREALGRVPPEWVILGCDAAGAGVGDEWAGLPIGLGAAGAERVVVTGWPIVDSPEQETLDLALAASIEQHGIREGLYAWQRDCARRWRETRDRSVSPHRWAGHSLVVTVTDNG